MTTLYITRHGETIWNLERRMQGHMDSPLSELGIKQAEWMGERLKDIDFKAVYSSPLGRAYKTAEIVCRGKNVEIIKEDGLKEMNLGSWEGKCQEEFDESDGERLNNFWKAPEKYVPDSGECYGELLERMKSCVEKILAEQPEGNVLIVTHAAALRALMMCFEDRELDKFWDPPYIYQTSLSLVEVGNSGKRIVMYGDTSHHRELE